MIDIAALKTRKNLQISIISLTVGMAALIIMFVLGAIFPDQFERLGLGIFLNRKSGVFAECGTDTSRTLAACSREAEREREKKLLTAPPRTDSIRQEKMIPFTFN
jgi:hypothetical protein